MRGGDFLSFFFLRFYFFIFREKHQCVVASCKLPTGGLAKNPGVCPDQELNLKPFGLQDNAHPTEPQQSGERIGDFPKEAIT